MTRPRGFIEDYKPNQASLALIEQAKGVIAEYQPYPITLRQLFYRLVAIHSYAKTEKAYKRLTELMNKARRAGIIRMDAIRDDGFVFKQPNCYYSIDDFTRTVQSAAESIRVDRLVGQDRIVLWTEAQGMVEQMWRIAQPYSIPVASSGGFDSLTAKHNMAEWLSSTPTTVLHLGDFDPSGVHVYSSLVEDIEAFCLDLGGDATFERIAVLPEHIEQYDLETAPPKKTDRRSFADHRTVQCEAFDPNTLTAIVEAAIQRHLDQSNYEQQLEREQELRGEVKDRLVSVGLWED